MIETKKERERKRIFTYAMVNLEDQRMTALCSMLTTYEHKEDDCHFHQMKQ